MKCNRNYRRTKEVQDKKGKTNEMQDKLSQKKRSVGQKKERQTKCNRNYRRTKEVQDKKGNDKRNVGQIIAEQKQ